MILIFVLLFFADDVTYQEYDEQGLKMLLDLKIPTCFKIYSEFDYEVWRVVF